MEVDTGQLPLRQLVGTLESLDSLLRQVADEATDNGAVRWTVQSVSMASPYRMAVEPVRGKEDINESSLDAAAAAVTSGLAALELEAVRPPFFNDKALAEARKLAKSATGGTSVRIGPTLDDLITITDQMIAHIDQVIGAIFTSIGTLDGRLEGLNIHGRNRTFNLYDSLHNRRIRCDFATRIDTKLIGSALGGRVAVHGEIIESLATGDILKIKADSLEIFPPQDELPTAEDVLGIFQA